MPQKLVSTNAYFDFGNGNGPKRSWYTASIFGTSANWSLAFSASSGTAYQANSSGASRPSSASFSSTTTYGATSSVIEYVSHGYSCTQWNVSRAPETLRDTRRPFETA